MNWFLRFINSSIGKKLMMALTGILLSLFLIIHLIGNLFLFGGAEAFNQYVSVLSSFKPLVRGIEFVMVVIILTHVYNAITLYWKNLNANSTKYLVKRNDKTSTLSSRFMFYSGISFLVFLLFHLGTIWWQFQIEHEGGRFYTIVMNNSIGFGNIFITFLYLIAMLLLGFHLYHGFQSAFQTFGIRHGKYGLLIKICAILFWLMIPLGFISIPIFFGLIKGGF